MDDRIEIWSPAAHTAMLNLNPNDFAELANTVMGGGAQGPGSINTEEKLF